MILLAFWHFIAWMELYISQKYFIALNSSEGPRVSVSPRGPSFFQKGGTFKHRMKSPRKASPPRALSPAQLRAALVKYVQVEISRRGGARAVGRGMGAAVPASRVGGSFFSKPAHRAALGKKRLLPYLAGIFSLWRAQADIKKPASRQETYVAPSRAVLSSVTFVLLSRPGRGSASKDSSPASTTRSALDPALCRFMATAFESSGAGYISVSKVGGTFFSRQHALRDKMRKTGKSLSNFLSPAYSLWKIRPDKGDKASLQEIYAAPPDANLAPSDFVLVSRPSSEYLRGRKSNAGGASPRADVRQGTDITGAVSVAAPTAKDATAVAVKADTAVAQPCISDPRRLENFVNLQLAEMGGEPIAAKTLGKVFRVLHPAFAREGNMSGKLLQVLREKFSLWQKEPARGAPSAEGEIFAAPADMALAPDGFVLLSRPRSPAHENKHMHDPQDFPALVPSSNRLVPAKDVSTPQPLVEETGPTKSEVESDQGSPLPRSPLAGSPGLSREGSEADIDAMLMHSTSDNDEIMPLQWSLVASQDYESNNTAKLTGALLSTDLTREDMARNVAALLTHFRHSGSFEVFRLASKQGDWGHDDWGHQ